MKKISASLRLLIFISCCGALALFSSTISKSPILPIFAIELGATNAQVGWIASMSTIPGILISYIAGYLADKYGYKKILIASLLIFASAPFLYLLIVNPVQLGAVRFYHGFATAAFGPVAMAVIAAFSGKNIGQNLSIYSSATMIGRALAPIVGGTSYDIGGHKAVYTIAGIGGTLALFFALLYFSRSKKSEILENTPKEAAEKDMAKNESFFKKFLGLLTYAPLLFVSILNACMFFAYGAFEMVFPLFAKEQNISSGLIGVLLSIQLVGVIIFKPFFGRLSDKLGRLPMMISGLLVCSVSFFLLAGIKSVYVLAPVIIIYGLGFALFTASTNALAADVAKIGAMGASLGMMSTLMDVGQTIGPPVIGGVSDAYSYSAGVNVIGAIMLLAAIACTIWHFKRKAAQISK